MPIVYAFVPTAILFYTFRWLFFKSWLSSIEAYKIHRFANL